MRAILTAAASLFALGAAGAAQSAVIAADADTFVRGGGQSGTNYGTRDFLRAERDESVEPQRRFRASVVRFDLAALASPGAIADAVLQLTQIRDGAQAVEVFGVADGLDGWGETTLTYDSATAAGLLDTQNLTSLGTLALAAGGAGDVLSLSGGALDAFLNAAGGDGLVSFVIFSAQPGNSTGARFASRESTQFAGPSLVVTDAIPFPPAGALFGPVAAGLFLRRR